METELDRIKSTITISLGTKNRLRKLKGSMSYEEYINLMLRQCSSEKVTENNYLEVQKNNRLTSVYSFDKFIIIFSYNAYNKSANYQFDINIDKVTEDGNTVPFSSYITNLSLNTKKDILELEFKTYFELLSAAIKKEIEPLFKHNGRFEDHFSWKEEYKVLGLQDNSFEEDIMQKLNNYKRGLHYDD
ncbi:MAG: hypothetical protein V1859_04715 [archaeon]